MKIKFKENAVKLENLKPGDIFSTKLETPHILLKKYDNGFLLLPFNPDDIYLVPHGSFPVFPEEFIEIIGVKNKSRQMVGHIISKEELTPFGMELVHHCSNCLSEVKKYDNFCPTCGIRLKKSE